MGCNFQKAPTLSSFVMIIKIMYNTVKGVARCVASGVTLSEVVGVTLIKLVAAFQLGFGTVMGFFDIKVITHNAH